MEAVAAAAPVPATARASARSRVESVDLLRGLVIVVMALDHVRDFFTDHPGNPLDPQRTTAAYYATRWVTHFCAPVFCLLAGTSAFLVQERGKPAAALSHTLLTRGLWLALLEVTLVHFAWLFDWRADFVALGVLWSLGWSMVVLSLLVRAPRAVSALFAAAVILGHNALDGWAPQRLGTLWSILHAGGPIDIGPLHGLALYPVLPWFGVMAAGYALGPVLLFEPARKRRALVLGGLGLIALFVLLRGTNLYGDPRPWAAQGSAGRTLMAILDVQKYPPSLLFVCATLGPALIALAYIERLPRAAARTLLVYGRVAMFFYLVHIFLIHGLARLLTPTGQPVFLWPKGVNGGFSLPGVYAVWVFVVVALYPACAWFGAFKQRNRSPWLSYL
jgi:uncharacterized membrane protein